MIPARKSRWFDAWFRGVARRRLARTFGAIRLTGREAVLAASRRGPVLFVSNHTAWWDALTVLHLVGTELALDGYALMDAANLVAHPYFARVGAFGIDRTTPGDALPALRFGARLLDRPGRAVWVFPQGEERPVTERPLTFAGGSAVLARLARQEVQVVPVALRYAFGAEERPEVFVHFGPPAPALRDPEEETARQVEVVTRALEALEARLCNGAPARDEVCLTLRGPSRLGALAACLLARVLRRGAPNPSTPPRALVASRRP